MAPNRAEYGRAEQRGGRNVARARFRASPAGHRASALASWSCDSPVKRGDGGGGAWYGARFMDEVTEAAGGSEAGPKAHRAKWWRCGSNPIAWPRARLPLRLALCVCFVFIIPVIYYAQKERSTLSDDQKGGQS